MPQIHNKDGYLSRYGLKCGYQETHETKKGRCSMWQEHGVYHIRKVEGISEAGEVWAEKCIGSDGRTVNPKVWLTTMSLKSARFFFTNFCKDLNA